MPMHKITKFLSEISTFFKNNDAGRAMFAIMNVIKGIRMNEQTLFGRELMYHIAGQLWTNVIVRSKHGPWSALLTTDLDLGFSEAYRIYSRRWSQEVIFKESKGLLGLGKCLSANFAAQIASSSLVALQYNVLSAVKRFMDYETIGELFRQVKQDSRELTITERIWQAILELVAAITKVFSIDDEDVLDALVNESDELAHICELYQCKMAS